MNLVQKLLASIIAYCFVIGLFILIIPSASAQTSCNAYSSGTTPPQGFGAAWNVFSAGKELILDSNCQTNTVTFKAGSGSNSQFIYKQGYYYDSSWKPFTFQGTPAQSSKDWFVANGSFTLNNLPSGTVNWVAYICQWDSTAKKWKCGCSDNTCAQSFWQLQGAKPSSSGGGGGPIAWPLKASANGRFFVDQNNKPVLLIGDAPQSISDAVNEADAETYYSTRESQGVNLTWMHIYSASKWGVPSIMGVPFPNHDISQPNEAYFAHLDRLANIALRHNMVLFWGVTGGGGSPQNDGFYANGAAKARAYGAYLGNRYKNQGNIIWTIGNDYRLENGTVPVVLAFVEGLRSADPNHLIVVGDFYPSSPNTAYDGAPYRQYNSLNTVYVYSQTYMETRKAYNQNAGPVLFQETYYETQNPLTLRLLRATEYWSILSGSLGGYIYGHYNMWRITHDRMGLMHSPGAEQLKNLKEVFTGQNRRWWDLVPDFSNSIVTAGNGGCANTGITNAACTTAARTPDGRLVIAYMERPRATTVNMSQLSGPAKAQWFNPATGAYTSIDGSPLSNTGSKVFTPPAGGKGDWVLVLEAANSG